MISQVLEAWHSSIFRDIFDMKFLKFYSPCKTQIFSKTTTTSRARAKHVDGTCAPPISLSLRLCAYRSPVRSLYMRHPQREGRSLFRWRITRSRSVRLLRRVTIASAPDLSTAAGCALLMLTCCVYAFAVDLHLGVLLSDVRVVPGRAHRAAERVGMGPQERPGQERRRAL